MHYILNKPLKAAVAALLFAAVASYPLHGQETPNKKELPSAVSSVNSAAKDQAYNELLKNVFYRGQVADKMIETGVAGSFIDLSKMKTQGQVKEAVIRWISQNLDKAAAYAVMVNSTGASTDGMGSTSGAAISVDGDGNVTYTKYRYFFAGGFLSKIKDLADAASDPNASMERMVQAGRNMYDGSSSRIKSSNARLAGTNPSDLGLGESGSGGVSIGGNYTPATYKGEYDDFKMNKSAVAREASRAEKIISSLRGDGNGPKGAEQYYAYAQRAYGNFEGFVSPLKSRKVITEEESEKLERLRSDLRKSLAGLSMRLMAVYAEEMSKGLKDGYPGHSEMLDTLRKLIASLDAKLAEAAGTDDVGRISDILALAGAEFSSFYMSYSVYSDVASIKEKTSSLPFSCVYDKLMFMLLQKVFPESPYVQARKNIAAESAWLDAAMETAASGKAALVLSDPKMNSAQKSLSDATEFSEWNKRAQYFSWGMFFRPFEAMPISYGGRIYYKIIFPWHIYKVEKALKAAESRSAEKKGSPDSGKSI